MKQNKINIKNSKKEILGLGLIKSSNSAKDKHAIYLVIKVHQYETSQGEITKGLIKVSDALKDIIESRGGKVAGSVSNKTEALINNDVT